MDKIVIKLELTTVEILVDPYTYSTALKCHNNQSLVNVFPSTEGFQHTFESVFLFHTPKNIYPYDICILTPNLFDRACKRCLQSF